MANPPAICQQPAYDWGQIDLPRELALTGTCSLGCRIESDVSTRTATLEGRNDIFLSAFVWIEDDNNQSH